MYFFIFIYVKFSNSFSNLSLMESEKIENKKIIKRKKDFIWNALEDGWEIKKQDDSYIFKKPHEGKKEVFSEDYLRRFVIKNLNKGTLLS